MQALLLGAEPADGDSLGWTTAVGNRPWIEHLILHAREQGVRDFVVAIGRQDGPEIRKLLGEGDKLGVRIAYLTGWEPLGTAGTVKLAEPLLKDRLIVMHANVVHALRLDDLMSYHEDRFALATLCLKQSGRDSPYGVASVGPDGRVVALREEASNQIAPTNLTNAGVYMLSKSALSRIPEGRSVSLEKELFPLLIGNGSGVVGYIPKGYCRIAATPESYAQIHWDLLDRKLPLSISGTEMNEKGIWIGKDAKIGKGVLLVPPVAIGDYARIGDKAIVGPYSVIGSYCHIGEGSRISRSVLPARFVVGESSRLNGCVLSSGPPIAEASLWREQIIDNKLEVRH
ncbi:nucleotidyltransferase family protein [Cohnella sp. JJ-181]|uniref:nucleotidyltransferase family protein n=1 Tax=Cohnella rhizoplanae TaxID=2974897 RepID=UPI0022FFA06E|nr:NDP-sugar synthase [Cohnella sp. JJ-181]CAI6080452.1 UTP--glucose-1-phosphate uridylyltransferase [Cohnella sp. JJ-181]